MAGIGSELHEHIIDLVRSDVVELLRSNGFEEILIGGDETIFSILSGQLWTKGKRKYPDLFLLHAGNGVCIEVGNYNPSKWFEFPVVHIGFNGIVTPIRCEGNDFAGAVYVTTVDVISKHRGNNFNIT